MIDRRSTATQDAVLGLWMSRTGNARASGGANRCGLYAGLATPWGRSGVDPSIAPSRSSSPSLTQLGERTVRVGVQDAIELMSAWLDSGDLGGEAA